MLPDCDWESLKLVLFAQGATEKVGPNDELGVGLVFAILLNRTLWAQFSQINLIA